VVLVGAAQSWIYRADFVNVDFTPTYQYYPRAMCLAMGLYSSTYYNWERGSMSKAINQSGGSQYVGETPWIGGPGADGSCSTQVNSSRTHVPYSPTPGNIAVYQLFAYGGEPRTNASGTVMDGAAIHLDDGQAPTVAAAATSPGGWVRSAQVTTTVAARDAAPGTAAERGGLGMFVDQLLIPKEGGGTVPQNTFANCHLRLTRCPESASFSHSYSTEDADPATAGNQRMPEGATTIEGDAYDATGKRTRYQAGTVKIDRSGPAAGIEGISEGELLRGRGYAITATAGDALSGPKSVTVRLDGQEKATKTDCPAGASPCRLTWTLDGADRALTEGSHTITVTATDQVGNASSAASRSFRVERTRPSFEVEGSLLPTDTGWVASGEQDLVVDAYDEPGAVPATGATHVEARIDGNPVEAPVEEPCEAGGCELSADFVSNTDTLAEGPHTLTLVVRDGAGNVAAAEPIEFKLERTPPSLTLAGSLEAAKDTMLTQGSTYSLTADATDASGAAPQSGLGAIDVAVDDEGADVKEQPCPRGGCLMSRSYSYAVDEHEPGPHTVTVTATDLAGNETSRQFTVNNPTPPEPTCQAGASQPAGGGLLPLLPSLERDLALRAFRLRLPGAFEQWSPKELAGTVIKPELDARDPNLFKPTGSLAPMSVDKGAADGPTTQVETDYEPICMTPTVVGPDPSDPGEVINRTAVLFANSAPGTDTLIRPTPVGSASLLQLRSPVAPSAFSWNVDLEPGQELRDLPGGAVAVIEPVPEGSEIVGPDSRPALPSIAERRAALSDSELYFEQATGALLRALDEIPDEVVAVIPNAWAVDALDRPVATTLSASGSTVTMSIAKQDLLPAAYPLVASQELIMGDSLDEWEVLESEADTADYSDEELDGPQPAEEPAASAPVDDIPDEEGEFDESVLGDPSASDDSDLEEAEGEGVEFAEPAAAAARVPPLKGDIALTESAPAVLYNPRRLTLGAKRVRAVVPWRTTQIINNPRNGPDENSRAVIRKERNRAFLWDSKTAGGQPKGWFNIATGAQAGVKSAEERASSRVPTDLALGRRAFPRS